MGVGALCLGMFVGFLVGHTLEWGSRISLKFASAAIGLALTGTPIVVAKDTGEFWWLYLLGLVLGLLWHRIPPAHSEMIQGGTRRVDERLRSRARRDFWMIISVTSIAFLVASFASI